MRVIIVDDQSIVLNSMRFLLKSVGIEDSGFQDAGLALEAFRRQPHAFDGLITDLSMPGMRGNELAHAVRIDRPDLPIVILSGVVDDDALASNSPSPPVQFLRKPAELAEIAAAMRLQGLAFPCPALPYHVSDQVSDQLADHLPDHVPEHPPDPMPNDMQNDVPANTEPSRWRVRSVRRKSAWDADAA